MFSSFDIWKMLAGIAFFLLAMNFMETSLHLLAGRRFKLFLKKQTNSKLKAIAGGAVVTALLQSSSIVNLLILSMVGAGVVKMENALAIMLGSNLGTTLYSWILATLGFNVAIEDFVLPVVGITGIFMVFISSEKRLFLWIKFLFSLAFLFVALGFIKSGMEGFVNQTDLSSFVRYPLIIFLLLGIVLTSIVQSSSATIALTLSALHVNAITLYMAAAIALGAEVGTTFKLFLASAKGLASKKRVALGNFLFNIVTVTVMFLFLQPVIYFISIVLHITDSLIALVFFQSFTNIVCIVLFLPFLKIFGKFLMNRFTDSDDESFYISKMPVADTGLALDALENETNYFISCVADYSLNSFDLGENIPVNFVRKDKNFKNKTLAEKYDYIKQLHGEIHNFYQRLQKTVSNPEEIERLEQLISVIRNNMYAAKNIKDAQYDIEQMRNSSNDSKYGFYLRSKEKLLHFYKQVFILVNERKAKTRFEELGTLYHTVTTGYSETLQLLYKENLSSNVNQVEISTLINFNRELYTFFKSILFGLKDYLLSAKEADYFDTLPGFIR